MIPAVSVDRRLIGSPPIALHDAVRSHHDLPDRVGAERMVLFVDDADLDSRHRRARRGQQAPAVGAMIVGGERDHRSEEHTSELQSLMRLSYAVFCWKKQKNTGAQLPQRHYHVSSVYDR